MTHTDLVLRDRYRLAVRLARGGMGEVWKATDELLGREVAVKVLRHEFVADEVARSRFRSEARFAASLQHPGIAQVFDYGEQDETVFLVMELVNGEALSAILRRTGPIPVDAVLDIVGQAASALHVAHLSGIVHRDVKPANLMITGDGTLKITDFGIARAIAGSSVVTVTGMVMGTAQYVSPEQASGLEVSPATDLYSLGVVAYECLAGVPPFVADTPVAIALKHVREDPPALSEGIPESVQELIAELLEKEPADRPASGQELADRAYHIREGLLAGDPGATTALGAYGKYDEEDDDNERRSTLFYTSIAVGVLLLGLIVVGSLWLLPHGSGGTVGNTVVQPPPSGGMADTASPAAQQSGRRGHQSPGARTESPSAMSTSPTPKTSSSGKESPTPTPTASHTKKPPPSSSPTPTPSTSPPPDTSPPAAQ